MLRSEAFALHVRKMIKKAEELIETGLLRGPDKDEAQVHVAHLKELLIPLEKSTAELIKQGVTQEQYEEVIKRLGLDD